jgi:dsRNA-specific ribonuclease
MEPVSYEVLDEAQDADKRIFKVAVKIGDQVMGHGEDIRKKAAEQQACYEALIKLNLIDVSNGH